MMIANTQDLWAHFAPDDAAYAVPVAAWEAEDDLMCPVAMVATRDGRLIPAREVNGFVAIDLPPGNDRRDDTGRPEWELRGAVHPDEEV